MHIPEYSRVLLSLQAHREKRWINGVRINAKFDAVGAFHERPADSMQNLTGGRLIPHLCLWRYLFCTPRNGFLSLPF